MRRAAALVALFVSALSMQGCYLFGHHDGGGYHKNFAYETPERVSAGHAHHHRSRRW